MRIYRFTSWCLAASLRKAIMACRRVWFMAHMKNSKHHFYPSSMTNSLPLLMQAMGVEPIISFGRSGLSRLRLPIAPRLLNVGGRDLNPTRLLYNIGGHLLCIRQVISLRLPFPPHPLVRLVGFEPTLFLNVADFKSAASRLLRHNRICYLKCFWRITMKS